MLFNSTCIRHLLLDDELRRTHIIIKFRKSGVIKMAEKQPKYRTEIQQVRSVFQFVRYSVTIEVCVMSRLFSSESSTFATPRRFI